MFSLPSEKKLSTHVCFATNNAIVCDFYDIFGYIYFIAYTRANFAFLASFDRQEIAKIIRACYSRGIYVS